LTDKISDAQVLENFEKACIQRGIKPLTTQKEKQMDQRPINTIRQTIGLGGAPNCLTLEIQFTAEEGAMESIMAKKMDDVINLALKFKELNGLMFSPETRSSSAPPSAAPQAPAGPVGSSNPTCKHGTRIFKQGNGAKGPWQAWMCPTPKDTHDQCKPDWITKK
jgi:hypothetical protein